MALIKCPDCNRDVSSLASTCLKCGFPVAVNMKPPREFGGSVTLHESTDPLAMACQSCGHPVGNHSQPCPSCGNKVYLDDPYTKPYVKPQHEKTKTKKKLDISRLYKPLIIIVILLAILLFGRDYYDDVYIMVKEFLQSLQYKLQDLKLFS